MTHDWQAIVDADNFFESYLPALSGWQFGQAEIATVCQPVLSVLGTETEEFFSESHELLHSWFSQVEDCKVEGVAHLLHLQRPEIIVEAVAEFFSRHPMAGVEPSPMVWSDTISP